jgi:hypothetical protein
VSSSAAAMTGNVFVMLKSFNGESTAYVGGPARHAATITAI